MAASTSFVMIGSRMFSASTTAAVALPTRPPAPSPPMFPVWLFLSESQKDAVRASIRSDDDPDGWEITAAAVLREAGRDVSDENVDQVLRAAHASMR